jgi:hypothetical protein
MAALLAERGHAAEVHQVADLLGAAAACLARGDAAGGDAALERIHRENKDLSRNLLRGLHAVVSRGR